MKKIRMLLSLLLCLTLFCSCAATPPAQTTAPETAAATAAPIVPLPDALSQLPTVPQQESQAPAPTTTLMVYMVGSDLEAKASAATKDLQEIAESGVNLSRVNVLVYAGGTPKWHNDAASGKEHRILRLTAEGFVPAATSQSSSMGESACLTGFLDYAWENAPADQFALILWDHGDGPVIGYGRDMLFGNDTLTLLEMGKALSASPFGQENKLAWVGFDACLMASAELSCTWAPYAQYLAASQEVEPSFGWNYQFLSGLGSTDTPALLAQAGQAYLSACEGYYAERGYDQRDTTFSCVDLSQAEALAEAVDGLFSAAAEDLEGRYNDLAASRVQTRALGRATTGSEYDLIDLRDLAVQMQSLYPEPAAQLEQVLSQMVTTNTTNAAGCCGMSLYYPFYNKDYYTRSWSQAYGELGLFPAYQSYLQAFEAQWLGQELLDKVATSEEPQVKANAYTLQLTPEQAESLASARYYILIRDGEQYYTRAFSSENVTNENGLLTANFDGNVLYVRDRYGNYHIPISREHDTVEGKTRYSVYCTMSNYFLGLTFDLPGDFQGVTQPHRFSLTLDRQSGQVSVGGLIPYDDQGVAEAPAGGKDVDTALSDWDTCFFHNGEHRFLTRDEKGTIQAVESWPVDSMLSGVWMAVGDGIEFVYAPLVAGEYYLLFEMEDTQGNRYCSELLPIETDGTLEPVEGPKPVDIDFTTGDRVQLLQHSGVTVSLLKTTEYGAPSYKLEATNTNDFPVLVDGGSLIWGEDLYCHEATGYLTVKPGETVQESGFHFGTAGLLGLLDEGERMELTLDVRHAITGQMLLYQQPFRIQLSEQTMLSAPENAPWYTFRNPVRQVFAREQVLMDNERVHMSALGLGGNGLDDALHGGVYIENRTEQFLILDIRGIVLNGIYLSHYEEPVVLPPGCRTYQAISVGTYQLEKSGIDEIQSVRLLVQEQQYSPLYSGNRPSKLRWCPVTLTQAGTATPFQEEGQVILDTQGIRVTALQTGRTDTRCIWKLCITNRTSQAVSLEVMDCEADLYISSAQLGPGQSCVGELKLYPEEAMPESVSFRLRVMDFLGEAIVFTPENRIILYTNR